MSSYASVKMDSGADNAGGLDTLIFTSGGTFECFSIEGMVWYSPTSYSIDAGADLVPPVPIAGVYTIETGTSTIPINGHLGSDQYVMTDGPSILSTVDLSAMTGSSTIGQWYGIRLRWTGVYQVTVDTDWYLSCGLASPNLAGHWRGHVRLGFY